jgi:hypothetical protein
MSTETKTRKGRKPANKTAYRQENAPLLKEWPTDYDSAKHTPLTEDDFVGELQYLYWDNRAAEYRRRMEEAIRKADLCRKYGSKEQRDKVEQVARLTAKLEELRKSLEG